MNYCLYLKGKKEINLSFTENDIVMESNNGTENIRFDEIHQIHLVPVRRTSNYYYPPACIIKTGKTKYCITSRRRVYRVISSMFESSSEDVERMSNFVHDFHKMLVKKGLGERAKYLFGGPLLKGTLIVYPFIVGLPVVVGFDGSPTAVCIVVGFYVFLVWLSKKRVYNPFSVAEDIKNASFYLS